MRFPRWMTGSAVLVAVGMVAPVTAGDGPHRHSQRGTDVVVAEGALPVRPVEVREVQVRDVVAPPVVRPQPSVAPRTDVVPRPFLPDSISRPQASQYRRPPVSSRAAVESSCANLLAVLRIPPIIVS